MSPALWAIEGLTFSLIGRSSLYINSINHLSYVLKTFIAFCTWYLWSPDIFIFVCSKINIFPFRKYLGFSFLTPKSHCYSYMSCAVFLNDSLFIFPNIYHFYKLNLAIGWSFVIRGCVVWSENQAVDDLGQNYLSWQHSLPAQWRHQCH